MGLLYVRTGTDGTDPDVMIDDLGINIPTGATWTLLSVSSPEDPEGSAGGQFSAREIRDSKDLYDLIAAGDLEWSKDGATEELAADYTADYMLMQDFSDDDLNLAAGRFTLPNGAAVPASGREGELFWESDDNELYAFDGSAWVMIASAATVNNDHGGLTGLGDDDHTQYLLLSGNAARNAVTGKVNFAGGQLRLPQAADVGATFTSGEEGDIAWDTDNDKLYVHTGSAWVTIDSTIDHGLLAGLGDDDHPQYFHLSQNETVAGVTTFNPATATDPAFVIVPDGSAPSTNLADGAVSVMGGILYTYDNTRTKWLSVDRKLLTASKKGLAIDVYLRVGDGIASSETGFRVMRNATITGLFAQTDASQTWTLRIRKNGSATNIASLTITAAAGNQDTAVNVNLDAGDELQFFADTDANGVSDPVVGLELAWRA